MTQEWTSFVVDYDITYDEMSMNEEDIYGVKPDMYLIPNYEVENVTKLANRTHDCFHADDNCECMSEIFESLLKENCIDFIYVGSLEIPFNERQYSYLNENMNVVYI